MTAMTSQETPHRTPLAARVRTIEHQSSGYGSGALCTNQCPAQSHFHHEFVAVPRPLYEAVLDVQDWQEAFIGGRRPLPPTPLDEHGQFLSTAAARFYFGRDCLGDPR